mmetsp:Transcript_16077/g.31459  ORF Transcript_16077/g.31459 Transcript_16077/m.31459 type:complete len:255 (+) Transcript_16077:63-827(+)
MRAWDLEVSEDERHMRRAKTPTGLRQAVQSVHLMRASKSSKTHISDGNLRVISSSIPTNRCSATKGQLRRRSRSRSADITPYDEHDRSRSRSAGCASDDFVGHTAKHRQGHLRAWQDEDACPAVQKPTIAITCEHTGGVVKCTSMAGNEVGEFKVPRKEDPYGKWLGTAISQAHHAGIGELCLVKRDGTIFWREGLDKKASSMIKQTVVRSRGHRFTGRERFAEGRDNRDGGCFAEYYTPRRRPNTQGPLCRGS